MYRRVLQSLRSRPGLLNIQTLQRRFISATRVPPGTDSVKILEVSPRDGLQNISNPIPTSAKLEFIHRLIGTGLRNIETTSFVSPKWIPQLADNKQVFASALEMTRGQDINLPVLVPNMKGMEQAIESQASEVVVFASASEGFSRENTNCSVEEALLRAEAIVKVALQKGIRARGVVSCIFNCPYDGPTKPGAVLNVVRRFLEMGCYKVGLGDTVGVGTPNDVDSLLRVLLTEIPVEKLAGHFHDTYGQAISNVIKSYDMGIRSFDSSVAGLGGCPYAKGAKGNLATEDMVYTFERAGVQTGIDLAKLVETGEWISKTLNIPNGSRAGAALAAKSAVDQSPPAQGPASGIKPSKWETTLDTGEYRVSTAGSAVKVTLTRPKNGNAMTNAMLEGITKVFNDLSSNPDVFHIILEAEGKFYCTGMDLSSEGSTTSSADSTVKEAYYNKVVDFFAAIDNAPQTTIAAVNGSCYGGGVGLAFACDIRLVSSQAKFTMTEIKLGLTPAVISKYLVREWGPSFLREAMLTGREVGADELKRIGTIHNLVSDATELAQSAEDYLRRLAICAPRSATKCKELIKLGYTDAGKAPLDKNIKTTFARMMEPGSEGEFGTEQFRRKIKKIDWAGFWAGKSSVKAKL
ncbi:Hypothetical protein R9X50_00666800 [Acrodontium crateriforme]|uniref:hydroxymethylglutaryl-CoA lyase n=1 Tax=Acrodontium crateriforme TaxID=150365 RepID=A0AAQ3MA28_9PEZI|nr:Hypothetical protein R9X50_00666800 [Acrodontium crateriforme]